MSQDIYTERVVSRIATGLVFVGSASADVDVPLYRVGLTPVKIVDLRMVTDTDISPDTTNYWKFHVERRPNNSATSSRGSAPFWSDTDGLQAGVWRKLVDEVGTLQDETLVVKIKKVGAPSALSGLAFSFLTEVR